MEMEYGGTARDFECTSSNSKTVIANCRWKINEFSKILPEELKSDGKLKKRTQPCIEKVKPTLPSVPMSDIHFWKIS